MNALQFRRINPVQSHTYNSFSNSLEFNWTMGSNQVMVWDDSYLSVTLQIRYSTNNAFAALPANVGLSNCPLHTLFSDVSLRMNNKEVSRLGDYSQSAYIHQLLTQSAQKQDNNSSGNPLTLDRRFAIAGGLTETLSIQKRKQSLGIEDVDGEQTITLSGKIPIFLTKEESGQNQNYILRVVVDPNWRNRISTAVNVTGVLAAAGPPAVVAVNGFNFVGGAYINGTKALVNVAGPPIVSYGVLHLDVSEMTLNIRQYETSVIPRSVTKTYMYSEFFSTTRAITNVAGSQRYSFTMPKTVSSIFFTMYDNRQAGNGVDGVYSPCRFVTDGLKQLNSYEIRYAGTTLPALKYNLQLQDVSLNRAENNDAFTQFIRDTMDLSPNGSQYSSVEWQSQPLFYHQVVKPPGSEAPQVDLELTFSGVPGVNNVLYIGAFIPQAVDCTYNDTGMVTSVDVYQTSE